MSGSILTTKLYMPSHRPEWIRRPELIGRLTAGLSGRMSLISAPAGYGKTTLAAEWLHGLRPEDGKPGAPAIAWLSLDPADGDPLRFMAHVIASLRGALGSEAPFAREAEAMLGNLEKQNGETVVASLINDLSAIRTRVVLVLEDYHLVESGRVDALVSFFLEHAPPTVHLVVTTRSDPGLQLARLRVRGELTEIRARDLRFSIDEATAFLNETMGLGLGAESVAVLERRTEGWIAGLQLAALSLRESEDAERFVASFGGSHRHVMDYLVEEVVSRQPESVQQFLLQTSILDRLTGPLCDAVNGREDGRSMLETLERANLFVVSIDQDRRWYRYHHLFADLLRERSTRVTGDVGALHARAAAWFERNGHIEQAIEHALQGGLNDQAAALIEVMAQDRWSSGDERFVRWIGRLDKDVLVCRPFLCALRSYLLCYTGESSEVVEESLRLAEEAVTHSDLPKVEDRGRLAAVRALIANYRGDLNGIRSNAEAALAILPAEELMWRTMVNITLGDIHGLMGDMAAAHQARAEAALVSGSIGSPYYELVANLKLAITLREEGLLGQTVDLCRTQLERAGRNGLSESVVAGWGAGVLGETLAELDLLEEAVSLASEGVRLTFRSHNLTYGGWACCRLVRTLCSSGRFGEAQKAIDESRRMARDVVLPPWVDRMIGDWQVRLRLAGGELDSALHSLVERGLPVDGAVVPPVRFDFFSLSTYLVVARYLIAASRPDEAIGLLQRLGEDAERGGRLSSLIEAELLQSLALQETGKIDEALQMLASALSRAKPCGFIRVFLDEGPPMARLLYETASRGGGDDYVRKLLVGFPPVEAVEAGRSEAAGANARLVEPLSDRELEVLRLIGEGLSNQEIGERLFISTHTVKSHTKSLFAKLDAHNRTAAVNKARGLGLLPLV